MQSFFKNRLLLIIGGLLAVILLITVLVIYRFGFAYKRGLEEISDNAIKNDEIQLSKKKPIKKIIFKNLDNQGCVEVTPDGIVRIYKDCGKDLDQAARLADAKNILKLIKLVSEIDFEKYKTKGLGSFYEITIETDSGNETIYLPIGGTNISTDEIIKTIEDVQNDIPKNSPLPSSVTASSLPDTSSIPIVLPSGWGGWTSPMPSSSGATVLQPFTCVFTESGGKKKPVNVSNIICSSDPL